MKKYVFNYEIYTNNPLTKECGWDIKMVDIEADSRKEANELLKSYPDYDCTILFNYRVENKINPNWRDNLPEKDLQQIAKEKYNKDYSSLGLYAKSVCLAIQDKWFDSIRSKD